MISPLSRRGMFLLVKFPLPRRLFFAGLSILLILSFAAKGAADESARVLSLGKPIQLTAKLSLNLEHFSFSFGSGLAYIGNNSYLGVTDNGPLIGRECRNGEVCKGERYGLPHFVPGFVRFKQQGATFLVESYTPLFQLSKKRGRQDASGIRDGCKEYSSSLRLDPEGIAVSPDRKFAWLVDEYGPALYKVNHSSGEIVKKYRPGKGLPKLYKYIYAKRGFEGVAVESTGVLWMAPQAVLDIKGKTADSAGLIRLIRFDPESETATMVGYSLSHVAKADRKEVKLAGGEVLP
ncbi:MAG: esterase-like activity of phytase family protein, partial [Bdellovibrionales bacterium]|nr:esterase-like activity of phytase family protein [Bdellovibrionales bacterium]